MWCNKCGNGHADYKWNKCGQCQSTDLTDKKPNAYPKGYSMRAMWKRKDFKNKNAKKSGSDDALTAEIEELTKGKLGARNYEDFQ